MWSYHSIHSILFEKYLKKTGELLYCPHNYLSIKTKIDYYCYGAKGGCKSPLHKSPKFQGGAHFGMQRVFIEKFVSSVIVTNKNHVQYELRQSSVKKRKNTCRNTTVSSRFSEIN